MNRKEHNRAELARLARDVIPEIIARTRKFLVIFRRQWYRENKTFGFGTQEIRIGGLRARLLSTADRLNAYVNGEIESIEELEKPVLSFDGRNYEDGRVPYIRQMNWTQNASAGIL